MIALQLMDTPRADRQPPHDLRNEQAVLGCILHEPSCMDEITSTCGEPSSLFFDLRHKTIFQTLRALRSSQEPISVLTLITELRKANSFESCGGLPYVAGLPDATPGPSHLSYCLAELQGKHVARRMIAACTEAVGEAYEKTGDMSALLARLEADVLQISTGLTRTEAKPAKEILLACIDRYERLIAGHEAGIPTGFLPIDTNGGLFPGELVLVCGETGLGKCLGKGTPILMFDGTIKPVEAVEMGDALMGPDSLPRIVRALSSGVEELFRVTPKKGDAYMATSDHILCLKMTKGIRNKSLSDRAEHEISVAHYAKQSQAFKFCAKGWRTGVEFPEVSVIMPPYILGIWLGDGSLGNQRISKPDPEIEEALAVYAQSLGLKLSNNNPNGACPAWNITEGKTGGKKNPFAAKLEQLGVLRRKHVPNCYKCNSRQVRSEILAGLLDTDAYRCDGGYDFISKDQVLAEDVAFIARSLGLAAYIKPCRKGCQNRFIGDYWRVGISGDCSALPLRIARKKPLPRKQKKDVLVHGIKVTPVGPGLFYGFTLDGDGRFLLGDFTVTHNSTLALNLMHTAFKAEVPTALFSLEMSSEAWMDRLLSLDLGIDRRTFRSRSLFTEGILTRIAANVSRISKLPLWACDDSTVGVHDVRRIVKALVTRQAVRLVVVDYAQIVSPPAFDSREQQVAAIGRAMRSLAQETKTVVILLSQLNDDGKVRESRALLHEAHVCLTLQNRENRLWIACTKGRDMQFPDFPVDFNALECKLTQASQVSNRYEP